MGIKTTAGPSDGSSGSDQILFPKTWNKILKHGGPWEYNSTTRHTMGLVWSGKNSFVKTKSVFSVGRPDGRRWVKEEGGSRSRTLQPVRGEGYEPASKMQSQCKDATKIPYQVIKGHVRCSTFYTVGADPDQESWYDEKIGVRGVGTSFYPIQDFWNGNSGYRN